VSLVIIRKTASAEAWLEALARLAPELRVHVWPDTGPVDEVEYVLSWAADPSVIASFPKLKGILSLGAGVDHVLTDATVPRHLPVVRMIDDTLTRRMVQYVVLAVLARHRRLDEMRANQAASLWKRPSLPDMQVGIMGLGEIGRACAEQLAALGYAVAGWSRHGKPVPGVEVHAGAEQLPAFLSRSDILVCLLPQTAATANVLDRGTLSMLPRGAYLINVARGDHVVDADLIALVAEEHLSGATLDAFRKEPLPPDHPFWTTPGITVTPHVAGWTEPATAARHVVQAIDAIDAGARPRGLVDRATGY
jgi:glyoxylate/hydroxypyruvate reductase A